MDKKEKEQTQAIQCTKKTKNKHMPYNGQKRQTKNTGHTIYKKHKGKAQVMQCAKKVENKHWRYNGQKRQSTNRGDTMYKK